MNKLLVMCPSRGRSQRIKEMLDSFHATKSEGTDLVACLDDDDPDLKNYDTNGVMRVVRKRDDVSKIFNFLVNSNPDYSYYCAINDDMVFRTNGWDKTLIDEIEENGGWGISFGDDKIHSGTLMRPTNSLISGNIVRTLGYLYPPELLALMGDVFLEDLGKAIDRLYYREDVVIEHNHFCAGKAKNDETYSFAESRHDREKKIYDQYKRDRFEQDVKKVLDAIRCDSKMLCPNGFLKTMSPSVQLDRQGTGDKQSVSKRKGGRR